MPRGSFIKIAKDSHFPIQNLPFGVFQPKQAKPRVGVAIGDLILDLSVLEELGHFRSSEFHDRHMFSQDSLNAFLALGRPAWRKAREITQHLLSVETPTLRDDAKLRSRVFHAQKDVVMKLPARIGNYTDFLFVVSSCAQRRHDVTRAGERSDAELEMVAGGVSRPRKLARDQWHGSAATKRADEAAGGGCAGFRSEQEPRLRIGNGVPDRAGQFAGRAGADRSRNRSRLWLCVNERLECSRYPSLGIPTTRPFLAKNFCTSISPWVVTMEALEPFRKPLPPQDPEPLPYLSAAGRIRRGERQTNDFTFDIHLEARLETAKMLATASPSDGGNAPHIITRTNFQNLYWSIAQQLAHHTVNGCNLEPGDLLASGTISGPTEESRGCMLELTWRGANPLKLPNGETRKWLEDGDKLTITGWCQGTGYRVGFGEVSGRVLPAL
jgi:fumarylacetoacetase